MKLLMILLICCCTHQVSSQVKVDSCKMVVRHLKVIEDFVTLKTPDYTLKRVESISFLEILTGIEGSGDGTGIGKFSVTMEDYKKWKSWFTKNKQRFCNTKKSQKRKFKN